MVEYKPSDEIEKVLIRTHGADKYWTPEQVIEGKHCVTYVYNQVTGEKRRIDKHRLSFWFKRWLGFDDSLHASLAMGVARNFCKLQALFDDGA